MTSTDEQVAIAIKALQARHDKPNGTGKQYPYRLLPFDELRPGTKSSYLVDGVIPRAGLVAIWGPPKCGFLDVRPDPAHRASLVLSRTPRQRRPGLLHGI